LSWLGNVLPDKKVIDEAKAKVMVELPLSNAVVVYRKGRKLWAGAEKWAMGRISSWHALNLYWELGTRSPTSTGETTNPEQIHKARNFIGPHRGKCPPCWQLLDLI